MQEINQTEVTSIIDRLQNLVVNGSLTTEQQTEATTLIGQLKTLLVE